MRLPRKFWQSLETDQMLQMLVPRKAQKNAMWPPNLRKRSEDRRKIHIGNCVHKIGKRKNTSKETNYNRMKHYALNWNKCPYKKNNPKGRKREKDIRE